MQIQAIISSFTPHFINNSLQWIQGRYRKDKIFVRVIDRLSKNMRIVFARTKSGESHHNLAEELLLIQNYLTIQQARFDDTLDIDFPIEIQTNKYGNYKVLMMQLLVHVENAIEHGFKCRVGANKIVIQMEETEVGLHIKIIDDGGGREAAAKMKLSGTQQGTKMLKALQKIFNAQNELEMKSYYEDNIYFDPYEQVHYGTCVNIIIPKNYHYDLKINTNLDR